MNDCPSFTKQCVASVNKTGFLCLIANAVSSNTILNDLFGGGFVNMIKTELDVSYPTMNIKVYNEGIGGNKTEDLINRINDVTNKNPDL